MANETLAVPAEKKARYPRSIPFIIGNEAAERFSFYGMRSILATFLVAQFFNPTHNPALQTVAEAQANQSTHFFVTLAYTLPFLGALIADWFTGKYKIILWVSIIYCFGHLCLAIFDDNLNGFIFGVIVVAVGAGGIKSCVAANVGDQFDKTNQTLLSKVYGWFYFSINAGSMVATVLIPWVYANYGASLAFGIPGILMALATIIFFSGRKMYVRVPPSGINKNNFVFISLYALFNLGKKQKGQSWLDVAKGPYNPEKVEGIKAVYRVLAVFAFVPIFWAMWDQNLSEWVLQAEKLDRHIVLGPLDFTVLAGQVQTVNPVFLLLFIPIFNYFVYPFFRKIGINPTPLRRIGTGLALTGLSFVIIAFVQGNVDKGAHPSVWWQIFAYVILSAGEVMVSITGLEYAYTQAPKSMKSTMGAIWLLTVAAGNYFDVIVNGSIASGGYFSKFVGADFYWLFAGICAAFLLVFLFVSPRLKERNYIEQPEEEAEAAAISTNL
ncbi:POT family MFS transporter [Mucilaginibacter myungsuensis]|uniref:POT family MFS transporter n=1 Tax=Mucilaginibacter myungsuensis TaxID=649104 RepID=A0A929KS43_9SPHI|nr:POT family MFS transporter [Mucilaginibacter myungsuensis]MBE9660491.1 POT family MFS transporter [Mucilaginibacter myungsuensis]MDN3600535.1 POT family MFS transporter [Mucilaginibacter myungsuensis]